MTGLVDEGKALDVFNLNFNKGFLHCHNVIRQTETQTWQVSSVMDLKLTEMPYVRALLLVVYHRGSLLG